MVIKLLNQVLKDLSREISPVYYFTKAPTIKVDPEETICSCGQPLQVLKTRQRTIITLTIGKINVHETIKKCPSCGKVYQSRELDSLIPEYCNFGYDVLDYVGNAIFMNGFCDNEVIESLRRKNIKISEREISFLSKKYILYLALAHKEKRPELKELIDNNGGHVLHYDGTSEGDSPHLFCAIDEITNLILGCSKASSESTDAINSLLKSVKEDFGNPLATNCDMSKANLQASAECFPGIKNTICHFHFLRDVGKGLMKNEELELQNALQSYGIKGRLKRLAKKWKEYIDNNADYMQKLETLEKNNLQDLPGIVRSYTLIIWILDYTSELNGYGFPFDRANLVFFQRLYAVNKSLKDIPSEDSTSNYIYYLQGLFEEIINDINLKETVRKMEKKAEHFDQLRRVMKIALPDSGKGLNDDGQDCDITDIEQQVKRFIESVEIKDAALKDPSYKKMLVLFDKYWDRLFSEPISVINKQGNVVKIQPQRTNNILERFFRDLARWFRKKTGSKSTGKMLRTMLAETPLVMNLRNETYLKIILNGKATLGERFAELEAKHVRKKMKEVTSPKEKVPPSVAKVIRKLKATCL